MRILHIYAILKFSDITLHFLPFLYCTDKAHKVWHRKLVTYGQDPSQWQIFHSHGLRDVEPGILSFTLKMETACYSKKSLRIYQTTRHNISEDIILQRHENLKFHISFPKLLHFETGNVSVNILFTNFTITWASLCANQKSSLSLGWRPCRVQNFDLHISQDFKVCMK